jgi:hypothetical protein
LKDIYFDENYGKLYEEIEKGKAIVFECKTKNGSIINQFIKRKIPIEIDNSIYYDIITPYGYGGPYIENAINKEALIEDYKIKFGKYCKKNNIVAEFIRFHPLFGNAQDFKDVYEVSLNRKTLGTNLKKYEDPVGSEFSKSCRKNIRRKLNLGMRYKITVAPNDLSEFKKCYYSTMERNNATEYYYFDNEYFDNIKKYYKDNIILVETIYTNKTIAAGLYFICNNIIHIHLSGTLKEYLHLSPAYMLRYGITLWGKENGYEMIHHGGGRTSAIDDPLYLFKEQFAKNTKLEFWIGKKVWNKNIYNKLCEKKEVDKNIDFFPAYRK